MHFLIQNFESTHLKNICLIEKCLTFAAKSPREILLRWENFYLSLNMFDNFYFLKSYNRQYSIKKLDNIVKQYIYKYIIILNISISETLLPSSTLWVDVIMDIYLYCRVSMKGYHLSDDSTQSKQWIIKAAYL
jgi:hypothetical protein